MIINPTNTVLFSLDGSAVKNSGQKIWNNYLDGLRAKLNKASVRSTTYKKTTARTKVRLTNYDWKESYKNVMFNPESFSDSKTVNYGTLDAPMQSYPRHVYQGGGATTLDGIELYYNDDDPQKVREMVIWLQDFLPYAQDGVTVRVPPTILFSWGDWYVKRCIVKSMGVNYTMFDEDLRPTECTITLSLEVVPIGTAPYTPQPWEVFK